MDALEWLPFFWFPKSGAFVAMADSVDGGKHQSTRTGSLNWADTFDNDNIMPYQDLEIALNDSPTKTAARKTDKHIIFYICRTKTTHKTSHFLAKKHENLTSSGFVASLGHPHHTMVRSLIPTSFVQQKPVILIATNLLGSCPSVKQLLYHIVSAYHV